MSKPVAVADPQAAAPANPTPQSPHRPPNHQPICQDTPLKLSSHTMESGHESVQVLKNVLRGELGSAARRDDGGRDFLERAFRDIVDPIKIRQFLTLCDLYDDDQKRWSAVPANPGKESELYPKFAPIFEAILQYQDFGVQRRQVVDCSSTKVNHHGDGKDLTTSPDFVILGHSGTAFNQQAFPITPTYAQCVSPLEIKTEANTEGFPAHIAQVGVYARQCFIEQSNRLKVYSVLLTETYIRLLQYDRGGMMFSSECNIHEDPETFVRLILGLASGEDSVGFDTSIFWQNGTRYIRSLNKQGEVVDYRVVGDGAPVFSRKAIYGRGTCCWRVLDPQTQEEYIIKEAWHLDGRDEVEYLEEPAVQKVAGVGKLVVPETNPSKTIVRIRGYPQAPNQFQDRTWCRMILEAYGPNLESFKCGLHLLEAFQDLVEAHRDLFIAGILHRDISIHNTLFGKPNAPKGQRGILIDLDMAIRTSRKESMATADRTGTRAFQSVSVLRGYTKPKSSEGQSEPSGLPHDHMDDLQSLFYVLCWVCYRFSAPIGEENRCLDLPDFLAQWDSGDAKTAAAEKFTFLSEPVPRLPLYFQRNGAFDILLNGLRETFRGVEMYKSEVAPVPRSYERGTLAETFEDIENDYQVILTCVKLAIQLWESPVAPMEVTPSAVNKPKLKLPSNIVNALNRVPPVPPSQMDGLVAPDQPAMGVVGQSMSSSASSEHSASRKRSRISLQDQGGRLSHSGTPEPSGTPDVGVTGQDEERSPAQKKKRGN
ncbi:hypothetical protein BDN72DRAFT_961968 [Pluteus cervinus]|uniref:Uncharacterized protein n=1 Tax=Pluteus cervinus TaxID=181527 RepID=A0ACD3ALL9_9AGAR|nr:hypothetical protein BDN72DRAFT_961968 [Pluteus cervinus]